MKNDAPSDDADHKANEGEGYAAQLRAYAREFRRGFLYEVLRWGNDRLLHGGTFQRLVKRACAEFAKSGPAGSDAASLILESIFRGQALDRLLKPLGEDEVIRLDPSRLLEAFGAALEGNDVIDAGYFVRRRTANLVVEFLRTLERKLTEDDYLAERFSFEYGLLLEQLPPSRRPARRDYPAPPP